MNKNLFKDIDFIKDPKQWPSSYFLPVIKRKNGENNIHGVIFHKSLTTIKKANLFMLPATEQEFDALKGWTYNNIEEMVADGWEVD